MIVAGLTAFAVKAFLAKVGVAVALTAATAAAAKIVDKIFD